MDALSKPRITVSLFWLVKLHFADAASCGRQIDPSRRRRSARFQLAANASLMPPVAAIDQTFNLITPTVRGDGDEIDTATRAVGR
jgi:hypothetical protein